MKKTISLSRGRTLSGHTWSTARNFFILNLSSSHPSGKPHLGKLVLGRTVKLVGYNPQLLGDSLRWSDHESDCSALFTPARTSSRRCCTTDARRSGTSCGGTTLDTHGRPHGLRPQGRSSPQDEALRSMALLGASRKTPRRYPEDTTRSVSVYTKIWKKNCKGLKSSKDHVIKESIA